MSVRTDVNPKHLLRLGILGFFCLGGAGWFLYDGLVGWPAQRERALAFLDFKKENEGLGEKDLLDKWKIVAAERGWPAWTKPFDKTPYGKPWTDYDINGQFLYTGIAGLLGLFFVARFLLWRGCWIEADEKELRASGGHQVSYSQITALDKKKWQKKGIAYVRYNASGSDSGKKNKTLVLDDCNYTRDTTLKILRRVEEEIGPEKIVNGKLEPPPQPTSSAHRR